MENNNELKIPKEFDSIIAENSEKEEFIQHVKELGIDGDIDPNKVEIVSKDSDTEILTFKNMFGWIRGVTLVIKNHDEENCGGTSIVIHREPMSYENSDSDGNTTIEEKTRIELHVMGSEYENVKTFDTADPAAPEFLSGINKYLNDLTVFLDENYGKCYKDGSIAEDTMEECYKIVLNIVAIVMAVIAHSEGKRGTYAVEFSLEDLVSFDIITKIL